jgi:hypothetical protein
MIEIVQVVAGAAWYVCINGVPYGVPGPGNPLGGHPTLFHTRRDAETWAEHLKGKCKDCSV